MNRFITLALAFLFHIWTQEYNPRYVTEYNSPASTINEAWRDVITKYPPQNGYSIHLDKKHWPKK